MKRGSIAAVAVQGDFGKPRPCLIVQSDLFLPTHASVTAALITTTLVDAPIFRVTVDPTSQNGLRRVSQIMVDKLVSVRRESLGPVFGELDGDAMLRVNRAIALWLGLG